MQSRLVFLASLLLLIVISREGRGQTDSILSVQKFFESVARYHPLVKQANLYQDAANMELLMNRGFFDPKLGIGFNRKAFEGKDYYNLFNPELKIPTWPGIDLKAGFERNVGPFVSDEHKTPQTGLQYLGVSVPLGQGLVTDARRVVLNQAKVGLRLADAERLKLINKILFGAAKDYWEWYFNAAQLRNAELAFGLANERYRGVKQRVIVGDQAPIDSVEARIFQQDREIFLQQSQIDEQNARLQLSTYLWTEDQQPVDLLAGTKPDPQLPGILLSDSATQAVVAEALVQHPELQKINFKIDQLELDRRLGREMLKPMLNVNYSWLSRTDNSTWATQTIDRNYKFGFDFSFPLFLRKERGKLGLVKTKILQAEMERTQLRRDIENGIRMSMNELQNLGRLIALQEQMVLNYQKLRNGEVKKFENGESSLFLINSRESKLIEALIKQAGFQSKYQKAKAALLFAAGKNPLLPAP